MVKSFFLNLIGYKTYRFYYELKVFNREDPRDFYAYSGVADITYKKTEDLNRFIGEFKIKCIKNAVKNRLVKCTIPRDMTSRFRVLSQIV